jgi:hypothetical protein
MNCAALLLILCPLFSSYAHAAPPLLFFSLLTRDLLLLLPLHLHAAAAAAGEAVPV